MPSRWPFSPAGRLRGWCSTRTAGPAQYTSAEYRGLLATNGISQSFSLPRQCWDYAVAESWFSTLKLELIHRQPWPTRAHVRRSVFEFIERIYNRSRLHSSLGYRTPAEYEAMLRRKKAGGQAA